MTDEEKCVFIELMDNTNYEIVYKQLTALNIRNTKKVDIINREEIIAKFLRIGLINDLSN